MFAFQRHRAQGCLGRLQTLGLNPLPPGWEFSFWEPLGFPPIGGGKSSSYNLVWHSDSACPQFTLFHNNVNEVEGLGEERVLI